MIKNKKASHVGVVLSFVVFVTFLVFLYSILEPQLRVEKDKEALVGYLEGELMNIFTSELIIVTVGGDGSTGNANCMKLMNKDIEVDDDINIVVKDGETMVDFKQKKNDIESEWDGKEILNIYYAEEEFEFNINSPSCKGYFNHEIRLVDKDEYIFESRVEETVNNYTDDYDKLKENLNVLMGNEFGFEFFDKERNSLYKTNEEDVSLSVFASEIPIQYVDKQANIEPGFIIVRVW